MNKKPKILSQVRKTLLTNHYSPKTINQYCRFIADFIRFNNMIHPSLLNEKDIEKYLSHLAINKNVSASTQNIALSALVFLYKRILQSPIGD